MSTNREQFLKKNNLPLNESYSLKDISKISKTPLKILNEVYSRGLGAAKSNSESVRLQKDFSKNPDMKKFPRSARLSAPQWASARVYSYVNKAKGTYYGADKDLRNK